MVFPFFRARSSAHIWQCCSVNSSSWLSVHVLCIPWHHALLSLPKSSLYCTDHQNRAPASLGGTGLTSSPKVFPLQNLVQCFICCAALSPTHTHYSKTVFKSFLNCFYSILPVKSFSLHKAVTTQSLLSRTTLFSFYLQWVFNSLTTWKLSHLYFPQKPTFVFLCYG